MDSPTISAAMPRELDDPVQPQNGALERRTSKRRRQSENAYASSSREQGTHQPEPEFRTCTREEPMGMGSLPVDAQAPQSHDTSSRSFAARAGAAPERVDPMLANAIGAGLLPTIRNEKRNSLDRPHAGGNTLGQTRAASSPTAISTVPSGRAQRLSELRPVGDLILPKGRVDSGGSTLISPPMRSASFRKSSATTKSATEWASERSPLQKLEVKLVERSKEEKRARMQEAEQRHRDSMRQSAQYPKTLVAQTASTRGSSNPTTPKDKATTLATVTSHRVQELEEAWSRRSLSQKQSTPTAQNGSQQQRSTLIASPPGETRTPQSANQNGRRSLSGSMREVRFSENGHVSTPNSTHAEPVRDGSKPIPPQQENLYVGRLTGRSTEDQSLASNSKAARLLGRDTGTHHGHGHGLKYEVAPQTEAGIRARQQIGFDSAPAPLPSQEQPHHRQLHLPHLLHHNHNDQIEQNITGATVRHLDEWKAGGIAQLTLADYATESETEPEDVKSAWWESSGQRRSSGAKVARKPPATVDGTYEDLNGEFKSSFKHSRTGLGEILGTMRNGDAVRARQYIGYEGTSHERRRKRSLMRDPVSILNLRDRRDLQRTLTSSYSYSCPQLSEHDPSHFYHICEPYVSKELTRSMRSIRVRKPIAPTTFNPPLLLKCGPLLRYTGLRTEKQQSNRPGNAVISEREFWRGSVMIVTVDAPSSYEPAPSLRLFHQPMSLLPEPPQQVDGAPGEGLSSEQVDPIAGLPKMTRSGKTVYVKPVEDLEEGVDISLVEDDDGLYEETRTANVPTSYGKPDPTVGSPVPSNSQNRMGKKDGQRSGHIQEVKGFRLHAERGVTFWRFNLEVELGDKQARIAYRINNAASIGFWVPERGQTMNIMFHSCNGFSMSVDPNVFSGPDPLWRDVLNAHQSRPFHVMIGGGDQVYNDAVMKQTTLFQEWLEIKNPLHKHEAPFTQQMQDEIETFYLERYSMWFSQGLFGMANSQIPMVNIWDDHDIIDGFGSYPDHFMRTPVFCGLGNVAFKYYMLFQHQSVPQETTATEPSWLLGDSPGPYIAELSRSLFMFMGKRVAFLGLDCRTERRRDMILSEHTYDLILKRCRREIVHGETKHLIVLVGVPVAYPRLVWLENILTSRLLDPIKFLGRAGMLGGFLNKFDGGVEVLDDLDDHWTARNHKDERNWFIEELQELAAEKSVRITILGGDVHLGAIGQFYSNKKLGIPKDKDHRYMPNIISSAIVNTPPPEMMADVLNKRNKTHHLNDETDEDMIPIFTHDVDGKPRNNKHLLPRRNWCSITEYLPGGTPPPTPPSLSPSASEESLTPDEAISRPSLMKRTLSLTGGSRPTGLLRRLSLSGRTPSSGTFPSTPYGETAPNRRSLDGNAPRTPLSAPATVTSMPVRPISQFHRRPTNLSEKVAAKLPTGGAVNLEQGLDIKLNCEIKQGDPSGSTESYRLLIPALWHEPGAPPEYKQTKRQSILRRLSSIATPRSATFKKDDDSYTESEDDSDVERNPLRTAGDRHSYFPHTPQQGSGQHLQTPAPFRPRPTATSPQQAFSTQQIAQVRTPQQVIRSPQSSARSPQQQVPAQPSSQRPRYDDDSPVLGHNPIVVSRKQPTPQPPPLNESEFSTDSIEELEQPVRPARRNSKFDTSGRSKFFGSEDDLPGQPQMNSKGKRASGVEYDGIEAYKEEKKGWRKFF